MLIAVLLCKPRSDTIDWAKVVNWTVLPTIGSSVSVCLMIQKGNAGLKAEESVIGSVKNLIYYYDPQDNLSRVEVIVSGSIEYANDPRWDRNGWKSYHEYIRALEGDVDSEE